MVPKSVRDGGDFERWLREKKELYERLLLSAMGEWDALATKRCLDRIQEVETALKLVGRYQKEMNAYGCQH